MFAANTNSSCAPSCLEGPTLSCAHGAPNGKDCQPGFDSHKTSDDWARVLFHPAQVLPCYVIHFEYARGKIDSASDSLAAALARVPAEKRGVEMPAEKRERLAEMTTRARAHLPFGFGPAGSNFKVLGVAEVSDDE